MKKILLFLILPFFFYANTGKIVALKGSAVVITNNIKKDVKIGSVLQSKDVIKTNKNSKLQILFKDNTIISIGPNSHFRIDKYIFNNKKSSKAKFSLIAGTFRTITGKIGKLAPRNFKLKTKSTSIGIRGTQILANISPQNENIMCTQGQIEVTALSTGQNLIIDVGEMVNVDPSNPYKKMKKEKINKKANEKASKSTSNSSVLVSIDETTVDNFADKLNELNELKNEINALEVSPDHVVNYSAQLSGVKLYSTAGALIPITSQSMAFQIDFGKGKNNLDAVTSTLTLNGQVSNINGKINNDSSILLNVQGGTDNKYLDNVTTTHLISEEQRTLNFVKDTSKIEGTNIVLSTTGFQKIEIDKIKLQK